MAKNGCTLKTIAAESVVGRISLANTNYLPFLAKSGRVLPVIATLLSFRVWPFYVPFRWATRLLEYRSTYGPQEQSTEKFRRGDVEVDKMYHLSVNNFGSN